MESGHKPRRYVLLDRDGTIIVNRHYQKDPAETELLPNAGAALTKLKQAGFGLALISNQSGVGRGRMTVDDVNAVNDSIAERMDWQGKLFDGIYYCPHAPGDNCRCRKPEPGLVEKAAEELGFEPSEAVVVGDREVDVELARAVGAKAVLVRTGYGREVEEQGLADPDFVANDLMDAAEWILSLDIAEKG